MSNGGETIDIYKVNKAFALELIRVKGAVFERSLEDVVADGRKYIKDDHASKFNDTLKIVVASHADPPSIWGGSFIDMLKALFGESEMSIKQYVQKQIEYWDAYEPKTFVDKWLDEMKDNYSINTLQTKRERIEQFSKHIYTNFSNDLLLKLQNPPLSSANASTTVSDAIYKEYGLELIRLKGVAFIRSYEDVVKNSPKYVQYDHAKLYDSMLTNIISPCTYFPPYIWGGTFIDIFSTLFGGDGMSMTQYIQQKKDYFQVYEPYYFVNYWTLEMKLYIPVEMLKNKIDSLEHTTKSMNTMLSYRMMMPTPQVVQEESVAASSSHVPEPVLATSSPLGAPILSSNSNINTYTYTQPVTYEEHAYSTAYYQDQPIISNPIVVIEEEKETLGLGLGIEKRNETSMKKNPVYKAIQLNNEDIVAPSKYMILVAIAVVISFAIAITFIVYLFIRRQGSNV